MAIHSSILAWRIPWTEKPGGLQSVGVDMTERLTHTHHTQNTDQYSPTKLTKTKSPIRAAILGLYCYLN